MRLGTVVGVEARPKSTEEPGNMACGLPVRKIQVPQQDTTPQILHLDGLGSPNLSYLGDWTGPWQEPGDCVELLSSAVANRVPARNN